MGLDSDQALDCVSFRLAHAQVGPKPRPRGCDCGRGSESWLGARRRHSRLWTHLLPWPKLVRAARRRPARRRASSSMSGARLLIIIRCIPGCGGGCAPTFESPFSAEVPSKPRLLCKEGFYVNKSLQNGHNFANFLALAVWRRANRRRQHEAAICASSGLSVRQVPQSPPVCAPGRWRLG